MSSKSPLPTEPQIGELITLFKAGDYAPLVRMLERMEKRKHNFWNAVCKLITINGITFPNICPQMVEGCDTATLIKIGSYQRSLHGLDCRGNVASLEDEDEDDCVCFTTFDDLVSYVTRIAAKQALTVADIVV